MLLVPAFSRVNPLPQGSQDTCGSGFTREKASPAYSAICNLRAWVYTYRTFSYSNGELSWP